MLLYFLSFRCSYVCRRKVKICRKVSQQVAVLNRLKKILPFELKIDIIYIVLSLHRISITAQSRGITVVKEVAPNYATS